MSKQPIIRIKRSKISFVFDGSVIDLPFPKYENIYPEINVLYCEL